MALLWMRRPTTILTLISGTEMNNAYLMPQAMIRFPSVWWIGKLKNPKVARMEIGD
jgi:hypothetical protein